MDITLINSDGTRQPLTGLVLDVPATGGVLTFNTVGAPSITAGTPFMTPTGEGKPELPATATLAVQDIATALVPLGLCTQAAGT